MLSVYLYKKLSPIQHLLPNSTASCPILLRCFENYMQGNCYRSTSLVNVDLSSTDKRKKKKKLVEQLDEEKSFTVSYLINSHGFTRERALLVSARTHFNGLQKPNSVLALLQSYGFTDTQIATVVRIRPALLAAKEKSILPKLDFFLSVGMSKPVLAKFISANPTWLGKSLDNYIVRNYNFLKSFLVTDERVIAALAQHPRVFNQNAEKRFGPNIKVLMELKVPQSCISLLLLHFPEALTIRSNEFQESVSKVLEMGFDPLKSTFVLAIHVVSGKSNKVTWDQCYETYSSWGWSKEDINLAFRKHPHCMILSQKKISRAMDFFVNKIGVNAKVIAQTPYVLFFSLEKRIIPRYAVIQVLLSKGLIKRFSLTTVLSPAEKYFLDKFVVPFEEKVPELYGLYKGKIDDVDL